MQKNSSGGFTITKSPAYAPADFLVLKGVGKWFGSVQANSNISFKVEKATIHALIGENGAGKSTCAKIIFGMYQPDEGEVYFKGRRAKFSSPVQAKMVGIGMVHQHFMLAGPIPAIDHILLDENKPFRPLIDFFIPLNRNKKEKELKILSDKFKMPVPWDKNIEELSVGTQQRIEILKLLHADTELLILDEPTAVLNPLEVEAFFTQLRALKEAGKTIIIITHKLSEVRAIADRVTIFRHGKVVDTFKTFEKSAQELAELMVGRSLKNAETQRERMGTGNHILSVRDLSLHWAGATKLEKVTFFMRQREVVGIAGVEGNGQSELLNCLIRPLMYKGRLSGIIDYKDHLITHSTSDEIRTMGVAFVPEDRLAQAMGTDLSVEENFILGHQRSHHFSKWGILLYKEIREKLAAATKTFDIRPANGRMAAGHLSGGNQQKLIMARELWSQPDLLIVAQPTRGVDIGASEKIHEQILAVKKEGGSVLLVSSDLDELKKLCDRLLVMYNGKLIGQFYYYEFDDRSIGAAMGGVSTI